MGKNNVLYSTHALFEILNFVISILELGDYYSELIILMLTFIEKDICLFSDLQQFKYTPQFCLQTFYYFQ